MLEVLIGFWIGTSSLLFMADGTYHIGGTTFFDWPMHSGQWRIQNGDIEFVPDLLPKAVPWARAQLIPQVPFRCTYTLSQGELTLSGCPYKGGYSATRINERGRLELRDEPTRPRDPPDRRNGP